MVTDQCGEAFECDETFNDHVIARAADIGANAAGSQGSGTPNI